MRLNIKEIPYKIFFIQSAEAKIVFFGNPQFGSKKKKKKEKKEKKKTFSPVLGPFGPLLA
jgi:hypothetical protein